MNEWATRLELAQESSLRRILVESIWPWVKVQIAPPVNIPLPTKKGSKTGDAPTPKWDPIGFDTAIWKKEMPLFDQGHLAGMRLGAVDGRNPPKKPWDTIVRWDLQRNHPSRDS